MRMDDRPRLDDLDLLTDVGMHDGYRRLREHHDETTQIIHQLRAAGETRMDDAQVIARIAWEDQLNTALQLALRRRLDENLWD